MPVREREGKVMNAMSKSSKSGGCGCGGSGGGCGCGGGGGCGCGGSKGSTTATCVSGEVGCTTCNDQGFARPAFFAGQLLTEEDLQALGDYVVGKNRLHNRHLFGDGVVCGLEVTCNPCGGETVTVHPGYALDCCGNDLLLSCPTELNINAMARSLRREMLGGHDCGDPCADKRQQPPTTTPGQTGETGTKIGGSEIVKGSPLRDKTSAAAPLTRHYCLYAHYCEEKTDPVSPYSTDDGCNFQVCQPTRVREGIRFQLRCRQCECPDEDILSRLCKCVGDSASARDGAARAETLGEMVSFYKPLASMSETRTAVNFTGRSDAQIRSGIANSINELRFSFAKPTQPGTTETGTDTGTARAASINREPVGDESTSAETKATLNEAELERAVISLNKAKSDFAAIAVNKAGGAGEEDAELGEARKRLLEATGDVQAALNGADLSQSKRSILTEEVRDADRVFRSQNLEADLSARQLEAMSMGKYIPPPIHAQTVAEANTLREWLLDRLDGSPRSSDCRLRGDVKAIRVPALQQSDDNKELIDAADALRNAYKRYVLDCVCLAINPPCAPCDDTGVLLACLEVDEEACKVVEICNLKRKFVITPTALRYWIPPIGMLGDLVGELCCTEPICDEDDDRQQRDPATLSLNELTSSRSKQSVQKFVISALLKFCAPETDRRPRVNTSTHADAVASANVSGSQSRVSILGESMRNLAASFIAPDARARAATATATTAEAQPTAPPAPPAATREELTADIDRTVSEKIATPEFREEIVKGLKAELQPVLTETSREQLSAAVAEAMKSDAMTKVIGDVIANTTTEPSASSESAITEAATAAATAEIKKLKLEDTAKELRELKRIKTENADLKKTISALEKNLTTLAERVRIVEGGS
jgi:hypothetical protein